MALYFNDNKAELFIKLKNLVADAVATSTNDMYYNTTDDLKPFISELQDVTGLLLSCSAPYIMEEIKSHTGRIIRLIEIQNGQSFNKKEKQFMANMVHSYFLNEMFMAMRASKAKVKVVA